MLIPIVKDEKNINKEKQKSKGHAKKKTKMTHRIVVFRRSRS